MTDELAAFAAKLPERYRYSVMSALRQTSEAGELGRVLRHKPVADAGKNPQPPPRVVRVYTPEELDAIAKELDTRGAAAVRFAAATGLRPSEWSKLERKDVDRGRRVITVRGTKTTRSRREVPLTSEALAALDSLPPRLDSPYVFAGRSVGRSTSTTSDGVSGGQRSRPPESRSPRVSTTYVRRSSRTRSREG